MNKTFLIGRIANDIEVKYTPTQNAVLNLVIAIDRPTQEKKADFPRVTVYGKQAENCERFTEKGRKIAVEAHLQTGQYQKDGKTVYTTDIIADRVEFLEFKEKEPTPPAELNSDILF